MQIDQFDKKLPKTFAFVGHATAKLTVDCWKRSGQTGGAQVRCVYGLEIAF